MDAANSFSHITRPLRHPAAHPPMKTLLLLSLFAVAPLLSAAPAEPSAPPAFPSEIKLTSGATLRNTSPVRWTADSVVVKHAGGAAPIRFAHIAEPARTTVLAARPAPASAPTKATPAATKPITIAGQIFSPGTQQPYLFVGVPVKIFRRHEALAALPSGVAPPIPRRTGRPEDPDIPATAQPLPVVPWPEAVGQVNTDAQGRFALELPPGEYFLHAQARRTYRAGNTATYDWQLDLTGAGDVSRLTLSDAQARIHAPLPIGRR